MEQWTHLRRHQGRSAHVTHKPHHHVRLIDVPACARTPVQRTSSRQPMAPRQPEGQRHTGPQCARWKARSEPDGAVPGVSPSTVGFLCSSAAQMVVGVGKSGRPRCDRAAKWASHMNHEGVTCCLPAARHEALDHERDTLPGFAYDGTAVTPRGWKHKGGQPSGLPNQPLPAGASPSVRLGKHNPMIVTKLPCFGAPTHTHTTLCFGATSCPGSTRRMAKCFPSSRSPLVFVNQAHVSRCCATGIRLRGGHAQCLLKHYTATLRKVTDETDSALIHEIQRVGNRVTRHHPPLLLWVRSFQRCRVAVQQTLACQLPAEFLIP